MFGFMNRLLATRRFESDMDEEMRHHVEARTEHFVKRGMSQVEAARAARIEFGGQDRYREEARETRWLWMAEELLHDTRYAIRSLVKAPAFTLTVVVTLMLGIGANTAIFSVVNGMLLRPLPFERPDRLVNLFQYGPLYKPGDPFLQQQVNFFAERQKLRSFVDIVGFRNSAQALLGVDKPELISSSLVTANFCQVLGVRPHIGRCITEQDETERTQVVMLSQALWARQFASDPAALGATMTLRGRFGGRLERDLPFTVIGVLPREFEVDLDYDMLLPASFAYDYTGSLNAPSMVIGRLHDGVTPQQAHSEMLGLQRSLRPEQYEGHGGFNMVVFPIMATVVGRYQQQLVLLMGVVSLLLLIACANVANLLLSRGSVRMRELSMRAAVGAGRARLIRQLLTESVLLTMAGGAAGLAVAVLGLRGILAVFGDRLPRVESMGPDWRVLAYTAAISIAGGLLLGLIPAVRLSRIDLTEAIKSAGAGSAGGRKQQRWMSGLLTAQVALCMVATIGAGLLIHTMIRLRGMNRGFDPQGMVIANIHPPDDPKQASEFVGQVLDQIRKIPQLSSALIDYAPGGTALIETEFRRPGTNDKFGPGSSQGNLRVVSPGYFQTMRIPLLRGRDFASIPAGIDAPRSVILSESLAKKYWPEADPLGQTIILKWNKAETPVQIVGIVGDVLDWVSGPPEPFLYADFRETVEAPESLMVRGPGSEGALMATVRAAVKTIDPNQLFVGSGPYAESLDDEFRTKHELMTLLGWFAALALLLTSVGVAGQVAYAVGRKRPEIAIRVSCGAQPASLLRMFCAAGLKPVALGVVLGGIAALALSRYVENQLFGITATDPTTFIAAGAVMLLGALIASLCASMKAIQVDPATMLRQE